MCFKAGNGSGWASSPVIPVDAFIGLIVKFDILSMMYRTHLRAEKSVLVARSIVCMGNMCWMKRSRSGRLNRE